MTTPKCRCTVCNSLAAEWIDDKCVRCYNNAINQPIIMKYDKLLLQEGISHLEATTHLREVELENNRFWSSLVNQYRSRLEVRMVDAVMKSLWKALYFFRALSESIRFFFGGGYRKLFTWTKK